MAFELHDPPQWTSTQLVNRTWSSYICCLTWQSLLASFLQAGFVENVARMVNAGTLAGVADVRDESDRDGMRVVVELKRNVNAQVLHVQTCQKLAMCCSANHNLIASQCHCSDASKDPSSCFQRHLHLRVAYAWRRLD